MHFENPVVPYEPSSTLPTVESGGYRYVNFHCYWQGELNEKHVFSIKSVLATQRRALVKVRLWLGPGSVFSDGAWAEFERLRRHYGGKIDVNTFDLARECASTPFERPFESKELPYIADQVRLVLMYKYGGLWFDLDCMFLKDVSRLLWRDFVYAWERQPYANNAILNIQEPGNEAIRAVIETSKELGTCNPTQLFSYASKTMRHMSVYPCYLFDPIWEGFTRNPIITSWDQLFSAPCRVDIPFFFPNSYVFHWHNRWKAEIRPGSYFDVYNRKFNEILGI